MRDPDPDGYLIKADEIMWGIFFLCIAGLFISIFF